MRDPCGFTKGDDLYISREEFAADPHLRAFVRRTLAEKISKIQIAVITFVCTVVAAFVTRHIEYKYNGKSGSCSVANDSIVELLVRVENTERLAVKMYDISRSDFKVCKDVQYKVTDLHSKQFPRKYLNAFGRANK